MFGILVPGIYEKCPGSQGFSKYVQNPMDLKNPKNPIIFSSVLNANTWYKIVFYSDEAVDPEETN